MQRSEMISSCVLIGFLSVNECGSMLGFLDASTLSDQSKAGTCTSTFLNSEPRIS